MDTLGSTGIPGTGDLLHPKVRKAAEDWIEDSFEATRDQMRRIRKIPDRHFKILVNRHHEGGWVGFVQSNTVDGQFV